MIFKSKTLSNIILKSIQFIRRDKKFGDGWPATNRTAVLSTFLGL